MSSNKTRLDKIETSLTPEQTVRLIRERAFRFKTTGDPSTFRSEDNASLIERMLSGVVARSKNESSHVQAKAVPNALAELDRQNSLWLGCDRLASAWIIKGTQLVARLGAELGQLLDLSSRPDLAGEWLELLAQTPYPLDPNDAAAIGAAADHHVEPWNILLERVRFDWLGDDEGVAKPGVDPENSAGLLSPNAVTAADVSAPAHADVLERERSVRFEEALRALIAAGTVKGGALVEIGPTPFEFMDISTPLIDREWIDRQVVELAEFGAAVEQRGFVFMNYGPWPKVYAVYGRQDQKLVEVDEVELGAVRDQAHVALAKLSGRTREIDGRIYLNIYDYRAWNARQVTDCLELQDGILASSWNRWIDLHGGEGMAILAGVKVRKLATIDCRQFRAHSSPEEAHALRQRCVRQHQWCAAINRQTSTGSTLVRSGALNDRYDAGNPSSASKELLTQAERVREIAEEQLDELSQLLFVITKVRHNHLDDSPVLPPDDQKKLYELLDIVKNLAGIYNELVAAAGIAAPMIDLAAIKRAAETQGQSTLSWLIARAKSDRLFSN